MNILIAGDYCPIGRVEELIETKQYDRVLGEIKCLTSNVDYSIVNLECPICMEEYPPIKKNGPNLRTMTKNAAEALKYCGFDMVTLANNHILDYGEQGFCDTLKTCKEFGLDTVGGGINIQEASRVFYKSISSKVLAIINICESEFSIATNNSPGASPINPINQYYSILEAKSKADYVIVIVHGGHENFQLPSFRMVETYRFFIDVGADVVVNHHQHCYSGYEKYKGKWIYYGLGNFCFDIKNDKYSSWNDGFLLELNFEDDKITPKQVPYRQCFESASVTVIQDMESFEKRLYELCSIISDSVKLEYQIKSFYGQNANQYTLLFEPYISKLLYKLNAILGGISIVNKKKRLKIFNYINCESHRERLLYTLNKFRDRYD